MINAVLKLPQNQKEFSLIKKIVKADISAIDKDKFWRTPKNAASFDYVEIGKTSDSNYSKEIISFFDKDGNLFCKTFRENGKNVKQRQYRYQDDKRFLTDFVFDTTRIKEKVNDAMYNLGGVWKKIAEETQWISRIQEWAKDGKVPTDFHTRHVDYHPETGLIDTITLTQYPINCEKSRLPKRFVKGEFKHILGTPTLAKATYSKNLRLDPNDKYLRYRFFDLHTPEGITVLTKGLLEEKGLDVLKISVQPNSLKIEEGNLGFFCALSKEICFSEKLTQKDAFLPDIIDSVAHEVEHAEQFAYIGRRGKGTSQYEFDAYKNLGELRTEEEKQEALKYFMAKTEYVPTGDKYKNNYLEVKAREAGKKAAEDFQFPIENYNFFERFN